MYRKIVYIIICCFLLSSVNAQLQKKILTLAGEVRTALTPVLADTTLAGDCKTNVDTLKSKLPDKNAKEINSNQVSKLTKAGNDMLLFLKTADGKNCRPVGMDKLKQKTLKLLDALKELKDSLAAPKDPLVKITIQLTDDSTKKGLAGSLTIDSLGKPVTRVTPIKDSAGFFDAQLVLNRKYVITAGMDKYDSSVQEYTAKKNGDILVINLQKAFVEEVKPLADSVIKDTTELPVPAKKQQGFNFENPVLIGLAIGLLIILLLAAILYFGVLYKSMKRAKGRRLRSIFNPVKVFQNEIRQKEILIYEVNKSLEVVEASLLQANQKQQTMTAPIDKTATVEIKANPGRYFLCEIMMTAGPRKKFMSEPDADKDLGEDVCGFISASNEVLIWVLDGTSDLHCLKDPANRREYFSSRLLALCIADKLRKGFVEKPAAALNEIMNDTIQAVRNDWLEVINKLPDEEKLRLKNNIAKKNFPECATTLLLGKLSLNGDFTGYRSGDSKLLLYGIKEKNEFNFIETSLAAKNPQSNDRIFFRLNFNEAENFDIWFNEPMFEIVSAKDVMLAIAFSDGIGAVTEQALTEGLIHTADEVKQEIILHTQGTADDKSICFLEIKQQ
jgi:hypothetical protein